MTGRRVDLLREVLDHEVVDADGVSCGMVDDIEFRNTPQGPVVAGLRLGPGAWSTRLPALLRLAAQRVFGGEVMLVQWSEVAEIAETIRLRSRAAELGLGRLDRKVGRWLERLPMS